jgi:hypothetical protein
LDLPHPEAGFGAGLGVFDEGEGLLEDLARFVTGHFDVERLVLGVTQNLGKMDAIGLPFARQILVPGEIELVENGAKGLEAGGFG